MRALAQAARARFVAAERSHVKARCVMVGPMSGDSLDRSTLGALLDWYVESGVDIALDAAPHDRYADSHSAPRAPAPLAQTNSAPGGPSAAPRQDPQLSSIPEPPPRRAAMPVAPDEAARAARASAAAARDLDDLAARLAAFDHAPFRDMAQHFLFSAGARGAPLMAIDFAPGEAEEESGEAFCGPQAQLLDNMLAAIGRDRGSAYLAYFSPWRPPGFRAPSELESGVLQPFLRRHIAFAAPRAVMLFGDPTIRAALGDGAASARHYGEWIDCEIDGAGSLAAVRAMPLPGLATLLKAPPLKRVTWKGLRQIAAAVND